MTSEPNSQWKVCINSSYPLPITLTCPDASYYYLRNVLHDHPDAARITLLRNIRSAMSRGSTILVDEKVLPDLGAPLQALQLEMCMLASLAGRGRIEADWRRVVEAAELKVADIVTYDEDARDKVITLVLP